MPLPLAWLDHAVVEQLPLRLWRTLFDVVGWPPSLDVSHDTVTHEAIVDALMHDEPTDEQLLLFESLHDMGTSEGADAIQAALDDQRVTFAPASAGVSARELVAHLFLAQRTDASLAGVFARAQIQVREHGQPRRYHEFVSANATRVRGWASHARTLEAEMRAYCAERGLGDHVQVRPFEDHGVYVCQILRSHRTRTPLAVLPGHNARATIEYRPVHCDHVEYDPALGRLRVAARAPSMVSYYSRTMGRLLFGDEGAFGGDPVCTLRPLQARRREALTHEEIGIGRVWMTECLWEHGDRALLHLRGRDCFDQIERLELPVDEGVFVFAKLKVEVAGVSTRPATVRIHAPNRIEIHPPHYAPLINRWLAGVGIRGRVRPAAIDTLWSLPPWRHPRDVWLPVLGAATDMMIAEGVLRRVQLDSVPADELPGAGRRVTPHDVGDGAFYGVSDVPSVAPRTLTATDLDGFELEPERLRVWLRNRLGLDGVSLPWDPREDLLDLGAVTVGEQRLHLVYAIRRPTGGLPERLRARAAGAPVVVLCPSSEATTVALPHAVLDHPIPDRADTIRRAVIAAGLEAQVPAVDIAPAEARVVVDPVRGLVWVDRVPISGIRAGTNDFRLLTLVAQAAPRAVETSQLKAELSGARADGDAVVRKAKMQVNKAIAEAMCTAGKPLDTDAIERHATGMVRCPWICFVAPA